MNSELSLVLPCYNPPPHWEQEVISFYQFLKNIGKVQDIQIILVNDGSSKGVNADQIETLKQAIPDFSYLTYEHNKGKGFALRTGIKEARSEKIIYTDIDIPYTYESCLSILQALDKYEIAVGIRNQSYYTKIPKARFWISKILKAFIRIFFKLKTYDTQGGLKGMRKPAVPTFLACKTNRYLFDLEFVYYSSKTDKNLKEVEVTLKDGIIMRKMNWKIIFQELWSLFLIYTGKNRIDKA